jgi:hypothetical protein
MAVWHGVLIMLIEVMLSAVIDSADYGMMRTMSAVAHG